MSTFGFIITRHVKTEQQNLYWNQCVSQLRKLYGPTIKIVVIDDASDQSLVVPTAEYENVIIIASEYPGRGELLPYVYYLRHGVKWFQTAIIIHDSVFFHQRIPFEHMTRPAVFLWDHKNDYDNLPNTRRMLPFLRNRHLLHAPLTGSEINMSIRHPNKSTQHFLCFGAMCAIKYPFLVHLEAKYALTNLVQCIRCRMDRCTFERIIGVMIGHEYPFIRTQPSLFGDIFKSHYKAFGYDYDAYLEDIQHTPPRIRNRYGVIKVWTGR